MTPEDKLARKWSNDYLAYMRKTGTNKEESPRMYAAALFIQKHTDPLTMEGVEWSDQIHLLAGADWESTPVVMIEPCDSDTITVLSLIDQEIWTADSASLIPNGKRYTVTELAELGKLDETAKPTHPEFLRTAQDYENAPDGTIVARDSEIPVVKDQHTWYAHGFEATSETMTRLKDMPVMRWGRNRQTHGLIRWPAITTIATPNRGNQ